MSYFSQNNGIISKIIANDGTEIVKRISPDTCSYIVGVFSTEFDSYTATFSCPEEADYCYGRLVLKHTLTEPKKEETLTLRRTFSDRISSGVSSSPAANSSYLMNMQQTTV
jgi:hypothetical protein